MNLNEIMVGDCYELLQTFPDKSIHTSVTSPPYYALRDYGIPPTKWPAVTYSILGFEVNVPEMECCLGLEWDPLEYIGHMVLIYREVHRVLRDDGSIWINIGDSYWGGKGKSGQSYSSEYQQERYNKGRSYNGGQHQIAGRGQTRPTDQKHKLYKPKDMIGIPWMLAYALRDDGWYLRQDVIWNKPNPMPESINDRCTKSHEYLFFLSKGGSKNLCWRDRELNIWTWDKPADIKETFFSEKSGKAELRWEGHKYYFDADAIKEPASEGTHERRARAKAEHKSAPDESRNGIRRKAKPPAGWDTGPGNHRGMEGRYSVKSSKVNDSFDDAMSVMPDFRNKRSVWNYNNPMDWWQWLSGRIDQKQFLELWSDWCAEVAQKNDVWTVTPKAFPEAHFATYPEELIVDCIKASCPADGVVLDMFGGTNTTGVVARKQHKNYVVIEIKPEYAKMGMNKTHAELGLFK